MNPEFENEYCENNLYVPYGKINAGIAFFIGFMMWVGYRCEIDNKRRRLYFPEISQASFDFLSTLYVAFDWLSNSEELLIKNIAISLLDKCVSLEKNKTNLIEILDDLKSLSLRKN